MFARRKRSCLLNAHGRSPWIRLSTVNRTQILQGKWGMALWRMRQIQFSGGIRQRCYINVFHGAWSPANLIERLVILGQSCMTLQEERAWERLSMSQTPLCFFWNIWLCVLKIISKTWWVKSLIFVNLIQKYYPTSLLNIQYWCVSNMYRFFLHNYKNLKFALGGTAQWLSAGLRIKGWLVWFPV